MKRKVPTGVPSSNFSLWTNGFPRLHFRCILVSLSKDLFTNLFRYSNGDLEFLSNFLKACRSTAFVSQM